MPARDIKTVTMPILALPVRRGVHNLCVPMLKARLGVSRIGKRTSLSQDEGAMAILHDVLARDPSWPLLGGGKRIAELTMDRQAILFTRPSVRDRTGAAKVGAVVGALADNVTSLRAIAGNPAFARLQLAVAAQSIGQRASRTAVALRLFERWSATALGVGLVARMVPAALACLPALRRAGAVAAKLLGVPMLAALPPVPLNALAERLVARAVAAEGDVIVEQATVSTLREPSTKRTTSRSCAERGPIAGIVVAATP